MQVMQKELAEILGITPRRIQQLAAQNGLFTNKVNGKYDLKTCIHEFFAFKFESETNGKNDLDYWQEKAKHEEAKRKITQMKLARMKRESFDASDVEDVWAALILGFKDELQSLPHKLAPLLIGMEDMAQIDRTIESEINSVLMELSNFDIDKIKNKEDMTEDEDEEQYREIHLPTAPTSSSGKKTNSKPVGRGKSKSSYRQCIPG